MTDSTCNTQGRLDIVGMYVTTHCIRRLPSNPHCRYKEICSILL